MTEAPKWAAIPQYDRDLFSGIADIYAQYRVPYPEELFEHLRAEAAVTGTGMLVDLACGTGEIVLPMAPYFANILGVDQEPDMIQVAEQKVPADVADKVSFAVGRAEEVDLEAGSVELVTIGNAFHRVDRITVGRRARTWLADGGCMAVLGSNSLGTGVEEWQRIARDVIRRMAPRPASATGSASVLTPTDPSFKHQESLARVGFSPVVEFVFPTPHEWKLDDFIGYLYSTSFLLVSDLGERLASEIEAEVRRVLLEYDASGAYHETMEFYYILGRTSADGPRRG